MHNLPLSREIRHSGAALMKLSSYDAWKTIFGGMIPDPPMNRQEVCERGRLGRKLEVCVD